MGYASLTPPPIQFSNSNDDPDTTHPSFGKRLANLRFADIPAFDKVEASAIDRLLSPEAIKELTARFDDEWRQYARRRVRVGQ